VADFTLPELGENVTAGDVLRVLVQPGDMVAKDQAVLELETDKATIEVPSSVAGRVSAVKVKAGDKVKVGQLVLTVEGNGAATGDKPSTKPAAQAATPPAPTRRPWAPTPSKHRSRSRLAPRARRAPIDRQTGRRSSTSIVAPGRARNPRCPAVAQPALDDLHLRLAMTRLPDDVPGTGPDGRISIDDV
jgi:pyruvate dehydrogenase E2 component (dihydrolipoamide acetyltransferase)